MIMPEPRSKLRVFVARSLIFLAGRFGSQLRDIDGLKLCRAFVFPWKGNLLLFGLPRNVQLVPVPAREKKLRYWRQTLGWKHASPPDFPRLGVQVEQSAPSVCHVVICHRSALETEIVFRKWKEIDSTSEVLIAYGGAPEEFKHLSYSIPAVYVDDPALRTRDHTRERQQYSAVLLQAASWLDLNAPNVSHVHLAEYDVVPTIPNVGHQLVSVLVDQDADVAGYGLLDISGSIHPHSAHESGNPDFMDHLEKTSLRECKGRILSMLGCSSIWTLAAFRKVAHAGAPRVYLEIGMPSLAHHLGFRVRPIPEAQQKFVTFEGDFTNRIGEFQNEGSWLVHPCKDFWNQTNSDKPAIAASSRLHEQQKPRLLLCGHTYGAVANRPKAVALGEWFDVMICSPDMTGINFMGRDGSAQDGEVPNAPYLLRRFSRWPKGKSFTRSMYRNLGAAFNEWRPNVVLCEAEPWTPLRWQCAMLCRRGKSRPVFVEFTWENLHRRGLKGVLLRWIYRFAAMTTDGVVCGNRGAERLFAAAGLPASKCLRTGQLGVDARDHPVASEREKLRWKAALGLQADSFVIGFCGRLVEEKGIFDLLHAAFEVQKTHPRIALVYLGTGAKEADLREQTKGCPWIRILPPVPHAEVPAILSNFDLFVLPSKPQLDPAKGIWEEQFGHVLIEAMMSKVPCIGSDSGGIPEVLQEPGTLFPPSDIPALAGLITRLIGAPDDLIALSERQHKTTLELWSHQSLASRYAEFIGRLMDGKPADIIRPQSPGIPPNPGLP